MRTKRIATAPSLEPRLLQSDLLAAQSWLRHGFSTRAGGVSTAYRSEPSGPGELNLGNTAEDTPANVERNRELFLRALGAAPAAAPARLVAIHQVHGTAIWLDPAQGEEAPAGDGLMTKRPGDALSIRTADCVPMLFADPRGRAVAAIHAGWRGTVQRVAEKAVGEMRAAFGTRPDDLLVAIGPSIRGCCYEVGPEVAEAFRARFSDADELFSEAEDDPVRNRYPMLFMTGAPPGHPYDPRWNRETPVRLKLDEANRRQLLAAGVPERQIDVLPYCTACRPELFFSHRRSGGRTGRMAAAICILPRGGNGR